MPGERKHSLGNRIFSRTSYLLSPHENLPMTPPLHGRRKALRLLGIGAILASAGAGFAYAAGWIGAPALTP